MSDKMNLIKTLRDKTGAGFLDCKNALNENDNQIEASVDYLRKKGLAKASKKSSRIASEGAIGIYNNEAKTIILKINSETDFASKGEVFLDGVKSAEPYLPNFCYQSANSFSNCRTVDRYSSITLLKGVIFGSSQTIVRCIDCAYF